MTAVPFLTAGGAFTAVPFVNGTVRACCFPAYFALAVFPDMVRITLAAAHFTDTAIPVMLRITCFTAYRACAVIPFVT